MCDDAPALDRVQNGGQFILIDLCLRLRRGVCVELRLAAGHIELLIESLHVKVSLGFFQGAGVRPQHRGRGRVLRLVPW